MKEFVNLPKNPYSEYIQAHIRTEQKAKELAKQKELDFAKWLESEYRNTDLSGLMPYCMFCEHCKEHFCTKDSEARVSETLCNKAYVKMQNRIGK